MRRCIVVALGLAFLVTEVRGQVVARGPEFPLLTGDTAFGARVGIDDAGRFLAGFYGVFEGRISLRGWDQGGLLDRFEIAPGARFVSLAELGSGGFAVVWAQEDADDFRFDILLQTFAVDGTPLSSPAPVNVEPIVELDAPTAVARRPDDLVVTWHHSADAGLGVAREIRARFLPFAGPPGPPVTVSDGPTAIASQPRVATTPDGRALVVWKGNACGPEDPSGGCIRGRHYSAAGAPTGGEMVLNAFTTGAQNQPAVAASDDGFVVVWESMDCGEECIRVRRFDGDAEALGPEVRADDTGADFVDTPGVGAAGSGEFTVAWTRWSGSDSLAYARAYDHDGAPLTGEFQVNSDPSSEPYETAAAMNDAGELVVVWSTNYDMWGRRLALESIFADGFESGDTGAWSAAVP